MGLIVAYLCIYSELVVIMFLGGYLQLVLLYCILLLNYVPF